MTRIDFYKLYRKDGFDRSRRPDTSNRLLNLLSTVRYISLCPDSAEILTASDYAVVQYEALAPDYAGLCNTDSNFVHAYSSAEDCNRSWEAQYGGGGPSMRITEIEAALSICDNFGSATTEVASSPTLLVTSTLSSASLVTYTLSSASLVTHSLSSSDNR